MSTYDAMKSIRASGRGTGFYVQVGITLCAIIFAIAAYVKYRADQDAPRQLPAKWYPAAPSPIARLEGAGAVVNEKLYVVGGFYTNPLAATNRTYAYDHRTDSWERLADAPIANTHVVAAVDGDTIWYAGGYLGNHPGKAIRDVYKYHVPTDRWMKGPPLPQPRASGAFLRLGRFLHYISGLSTDRNTNYGDHWILSLDGRQEWLRRAPLPLPRAHMAGVAIDGKIFVVAGQIGHDIRRRDVDTVHRYDPETDTWSEMSPLPFASSHHETSTVVWNGRIYLFGGRSDHYKGVIERLKNPPPRRRAAALPDVFAYDPSSNKWSPQPELPAGLLAPVVVTIGNKIIVTNGSTMNAFFPQSSTYVGCFPLETRMQGSRQRRC